MIKLSIIKIYYSILFVFSAILTISYSNISRGGSILWIGTDVFYFSMLIFASSLTYVILNSNFYYLERLKSLGVLLFCLSLPLLLNIGIHQFPTDLDSIISMRSISFISNYGFSTDLIRDDSFLIGATYSLPILSILSASFMQILGITDIATAKYIPLILLCIFFFIYYAFISKYIDKLVALLSLIFISTFMWGYSGVFSNVDLGLVFFILTWFFLLWRCHHKKYNINVVIIQIIILIAFVMSHHLTYVVFIVTIVFASVYIFTIKQKKVVNIDILSVVLMFSYYIFVHLGPLEVMINALTHQLVIEGKTTGEVTTWTFPIILQRASYVIFLIPPTILSIIEIKKDLNGFLVKKYSIFLAMGYFLFLVSVIGVFIKVPWNWDRITIFAWMFYIPGAASILIESNLLKSKHIKQVIILFISSLLIFGNIYAVPDHLLDHSGNREYEGSFKNWIKLQEWDYAIFLNKNINESDLVVGDEVVRRTYLVNSPNYRGNFNYISSDFNKTKNLHFTYLVYRKENFYNIVGSFAQQTPNEEDVNEIKGASIYEKINHDAGIFLIYNNEEVKIFHQNLNQ